MVAIGDHPVDPRCGFDKLSTMGIFGFFWEHFGTSTRHKLKILKNWLSYDML